MVKIISDLFVNLHFSSFMANIFSLLSIAFSIAIISWISNYVAKKYLVRLAGEILKRAKPSWSKHILRNNVMGRLANLAPAIMIYVLVDFLPSGNQDFTKTIVPFIQRLSIVAMLIVTTVGLSSIFKTLEDIYNTYPISRKRPIKSYLQVINTVIFFICVVFVISTFLHTSPWGLFTGLGAATAIIILIFKDSILGVVASVQLASFDMIRIGDWITMTSYGADGDVMEISLTTVKVRNFDKTITTIPTYALLSSGVKNWRGMEEAGGRRIKRSIKIDLKSIKFCNKDLLKKIKKINILEGYFEKLGEDFSASKIEVLHDVSEVDLNRRQLTNVGLYRIYITEYLKRNEYIHTETGFSFVVRQLEPTETGLPLQVYTFTKSTRWIEYENIQANIFDHLLASLQTFELQAFQNLGQIKSS